MNLMKHLRKSYKMHNNMGITLIKTHFCHKKKFNRDMRNIKKPWKTHY